MNYIIRRAKLSEIEGILKMIEANFKKHIAPIYSQEGMQTFLKYINLDRILARQDNHQFLIAVHAENQEILGAIELREFRHFSLFFTHQDYLGQGIGKALFRKGVEVCVTENPSLSEITLFSSPYAIEIYKKLGFEITAPETIKDGMRFTPMRLPLIA